MTRDEIVMILGDLKALYPSFYKDMNKIDMLKTIDLWHSAFKDEKVEIVKEAINELMKTSSYIPTIADVTKKISEIKKTDYLNANWNSCYWYEIEREWCEKNNHPYYDITKGPDYPLPPFKE